MLGIKGAPLWTLNLLHQRIGLSCLLEIEKAAKIDQPLRRSRSTCSGWLLFLKRQLSKDSVTKVTHSVDLRSKKSACRLLGTDRTSKYAPTRALPPFPALSSPNIHVSLSQIDIPDRDIDHSRSHARLLILLICMQFIILLGTLQGITQ